MLVHACATSPMKTKWSGSHHTIQMLHFVLFHSVTCYTNFIVSRIHVNTTKLRNITHSLVATGFILRSLECTLWLYFFVHVPVDCNTSSNKSPTSSGAILYCHHHHFAELNKNNLKQNNTIYYQNYNQTTNTWQIHINKSNTSWCKTWDEHIGLYCNRILHPQLCNKVSNALELSIKILQRGTKLGVCCLFEGVFYKPLINFPRLWKVCFECISHKIVCGVLWTSFEVNVWYICMILKYGRWISCKGKGVYGSLHG
jgi:hypothetical protein